MESPHVPGDQLVVEVLVSDLDRSMPVYTALGFILERSPVRSWRPFGAGSPAS